MLGIPLENIDRWSATRNDRLDMLRGWKDRIEAAQSDPEAFGCLLAFLRADDEESRH